MPSEGAFRVRPGTVLRVHYQFTGSSRKENVSYFLKIKNGFGAVASWPSVCCSELQINEKINQGNFQNTGYSGLTWTLQRASSSQIRERSKGSYEEGSGSRTQTTQCTVWMTLSLELKQDSPTQERLLGSVRPLKQGQEPWSLLHYLHFLSFIYASPESTCCL